MTEQIDGDVIRSWVDALSSVCVRHPNPRARAVVTLSGGPNPRLTLHVRDANDTTTDEPHARNPLLISSVRLTYFPGHGLARQWLACAWAGFVQHEALELVTMAETGDAVLDPHREPYESNAWNRGLRDGLPAILTPATLRAALCVVMDGDAADNLITGAS